MRRHLAACERQRNQRLAVRLFSELAAVLRRDPDRERPLLGDRRIVDDQHRIVGADDSVGLLGQHPPQRRIVPSFAADEVVQLVVAVKPKTCRDR